ncbi:MAG: NAD(P)-dependent oxidoreductase [Bacteroidetes bacterium]|nr:NAD(P)-dependent oxidoreductase [Bacteroidota bacterium]
MKIGFIGLGSLGTPMAINLVESGHTVHVYNRTVSKSAPLAAMGAIVEKDVASLAKQCSVVFTIVSDDAVLKSICEGDGGLIKNLQPEAVHVSMSTILPQTAKDLDAKHRQQKQHYLASPVFGRPDAAVAKKINFVLSGEEKIRKQIEPLARDAGAINVWDFGDEITAANTVKLCGNFLIGAALEAIGESTALAKASGVDEQKMWSMLLQTIFNAPIYHNYSNIILQKKFEPAAFSMKLGLKDMNLVLQQASATNQQMPLANLLKENMQELVASGKDEIDWSALATAKTKL